MPNVSGFVDWVAHSPNHLLEYSGAFYAYGSGSYSSGNAWNSFALNTSRVSSEYKDSIKEVRVKSIISNGFIKLY